ncbi:MAG TPA: GAF domain-containing sensor histidine kinase [Solirubrobacteraceae bacterium]
MDSTDTGVARLVEEHAALRRIAMLVARGADRVTVFTAVAEEVGRLLEADAANVIRFDDGVGTIVAGWKTERGPDAPVGFRLSTQDDTAVGRVYRTRRPARVDSYERPGPVFAALRELGLAAAAGAPVVVDGELWGAVMVGSARAAPFPPGAEQRLGAFAELVAQALANAEAREELTASRKRLVEAAQLERRRLERNLHDGAQQRLVGVSITLGLAERRLERDPERAREALVRARTELAEALEELRELARGLHPAGLTDRGLEAALGALAARAAVPVALTVELDGRPREAVEAAVYFIVAEALTNVARYASAGSAAVSVRREAGGLHVEVTDDGKGGADPAAGSGLRGLIDRVEALGGRLDVRSPRGRGTTLRAWLPEA